ncbi:MAG: mRNA interferase MazF [Planctomycetota bacterium]|jgi:mRNA interferase MazF|nr:mRNA interferase MazF [Planctomycetota bacterium]
MWGLKRNKLRPNRIFTIDSPIILYRMGSLKTEKLTEIIDKVVEIIRK